MTIGGLTFARETLEPGWRWVIARQASRRRSELPARSRQDLCRRPPPAHRYGRRDLEPRPRWSLVRVTSRSSTRVMTAGSWVTNRTYSSSSRRREGAMTTARSAVWSAVAQSSGASRPCRARGPRSTPTDTCTHGISLHGPGRSSGRHGRPLGRRRSFAGRAPLLRLVRSARNPADAEHPQAIGPGRQYPRSAGVYPNHMVGVQGQLGVGDAD